MKLTLNGQERVLEGIDPDMPLLWAIRDMAGLTGTKFGCGRALCGACTVHVDGEPVRSCSFPVSAADGRSVTTIEGMGSENQLHPLQEAFRAEHGLQCGFCTPGILLTLKEYLARRPEATEAELRRALSGNLCRCTGYQNIVAAALRAAGRAASEPAAGVELQTPLGAAVMGEARRYMAGG